MKAQSKHSIDLLAMYAEGTITTLNGSDVRAVLDELRIIQQDRDMALALVDIRTMERDELIETLTLICEWEDTQDIPFHALIDRGKRDLFMLKNEGQKG